MVLGVGDTFSERHCTSALLLCHDGFKLAIDCPDRYRGVLRGVAAACGRPLPLSEIQHVLITHVHGDHMNGLEGVAFWKRFAEGTRVQLLAAPEVRASLWEGRLRAPMESLWEGHEFRRMGFEDYFDHLPLSWSDAVEAGPFRIRARRTLHHVPTSALRIECAGRTLAYSADTAFDRGLVDWLSEADLIVHETNLGPAHTPYESLATLPEPLRRRMRLIHYPDGFDANAAAIAALREGEVLRLK
ncbi:MAG: MBL fold metallo-hydrolase [Planctomycetes bacterium]|nr:MBL fold metallo-hydrolase [Planctomycetota bacterium]